MENNYNASIPITTQAHKIPQIPSDQAARIIETPLPVKGEEATIEKQKLVG